MKRSFAVAATLLLMACGKPDASGIYVAKSDHEVMLVQLVQGDDGKLTGRVEASTMATDGTITTKDGVLEGSVSGHDLMLKPASIWLGGLQASGSFTGNKLTLAGKGFSLEADKSSLEGYQEAVAKLQSSAGEKRKDVAQAKAETAEYKARFDAANAMEDRKAKIVTLTASLRQIVSRLDNAFAKSPNFGERASANTTRVSQLVEKSHGKPDLVKNQMAVAANQIEVDTNQIEVARSQYAIGLNSIVDDAKGVIGQMSQLCGNGPPSELASQCNDAKAAGKAFAQAFERGANTFGQHRAKVQQEIDRQNALASSIEG